MNPDKRLSLDPAGKNCWAMRTFNYGGKNYATGDRFPWLQLSCSVRKAQLLFEGRFITSGEATPEPEPVRTPETKSNKKKAPTKTAVKPADND